MTSWLAYLRWLWSGDPKPPTGIVVYRKPRSTVAFVWGNGTGDQARLEKYENLLLEFVRQGATVVACETTQAFDGVDLAKAAQYARSLYGITTVCGIGHSGGGAGVLRAAGKVLFDRLVVMATGRDVYPLPSCPALFVAGDRDTTIDLHRFLELAKVYPGPKTIATHALADHFDITRRAGEAAAEFGLRGTVEAIKDDPYWTIVT